MWLKDKVIFLDIPKCGTTSMHKAAGFPKHLPHPMNSVPNKVGHTKHSRHIPNSIDYSYIFTVVRNPYTRSISLWNHVNKLKNSLLNGKIKRTANQYLTEEYFNSFEHFLEVCKEINENVDSVNETETFLLVHCSCYTWTRSLPRVDKVIRLEEFEKERYLLPLRIDGLPVINIGKEHFILSKDQRIKIEQAFFEDFHLYEYNISNPAPPSRNLE